MRESSNRNGKLAGGSSRGTFLRWARGRTEDEFFRWRQHVDGKGHLILVDLQPNPAEKVGQDPRSDCHCCDKEVRLVLGWEAVAGCWLLLWIAEPLEL